MTCLEIIPLPLLSDNYAYLLHCRVTGTTAVVDPSEAAPVADAVTARGWQLDLIINTHHHWDHVGGNGALKERFGAKLAAPEADRHRLVGVDLGLVEGQVLAVGQATARIMEIPGHTRGHVALWFPAEQAVFTGDTLFSLGCGRLFEGTPAEMWQSLGRLAELPGETRVFCGHEYTASNARFAVTVTPDDDGLLARQREINALRAAQRPTIPSTIAAEKRFNPFLRADGVAAFARLRQQKDGFKG